MKKELEVLSSIEKLSGTGSQKAKQELLKKNLTPKMEYILQIGFNPFITTKLNKIEVPTSGKEVDIFSFSSSKELTIISGEDPFSSFKELMETLIKVKSANNDLREKAATFVKEMELEKDLESILVKLMTKNLNIGMGAKLINGAIGKELIPDPELMLAQSDEKEIEKWEKIWCEEKYDGVRVIAMMKNDDIIFYTRNFNELDPSCLTKISGSLLKAIERFGLLNGEYFFDGELTDLNRQSVSGKINRILKGKAPKDIDNDFIFNIFDIEEVPTLSKGKGNTLYSERRKALEHFFVHADHPLILAERWEVQNKEDIMEVYQEIIKKGGEGVIVKNDHYYECKRSKSWIKLKEVNDCDLIITGWYPGNKYSLREKNGWIGGFTCESSCGKLSVGVGSGFTEDMLKEIKGNEDSYIGKVIKVLYNIPIKDEHGSDSLFLPRCAEIRSDKTKADSLEKILGDFKKSNKKEE